MKNTKTVTRIGFTFALVVGLTAVAWPSQAVPTDPVSTALPAAQPLLAPAVCQVTQAQLREGVFWATEAAGKYWTGAGPDYINCRVNIRVRPDKLPEVMSKMRAIGGLVPVEYGQPMPASAPGAIVVEVQPSARACILPFPPPPCGWEYQQIALSPDMSGNGRGEILAVDEASSLFRFGLKPGNKLDNPVYLGSGWRHVKVYAPGDWNGDGNSDLIGVGQSGQMYLYPGNGSGGIRSRVQIGHGWSKYTVIPAGDLNGDRIPDMLAINKQTGVLLMYAGNGKGGFKPGYQQVGHGWKDMQLFAAGDMNKDGKIDILGLKSDGRLFFYAGKGSGTFRPGIQVGHGWTGLVLAAGADLDGDGKADIVGRNNNGDLLFYRGGGVGTFAKPIKLASGW